MKSNPLCRASLVFQTISVLLSAVVLMGSLNLAAAQSQTKSPQENKPNEAVKDNDKELTKTSTPNDRYGKGGMLESFSNDKRKLDREVWRDKDGDVREIHKFEGDAEEWWFYSKPKAVKYYFRFGKDGSGTAFRGANAKQLVTETNNPTRREVQDWVDKIEDQFAKDGTLPELPKTGEAAKPFEIPAPPLPPPLSPKTGDTPKATETGGRTIDEAQSFAAPGYKFGSERNGELLTINMTTPNGGIYIYIPLDVAVGDNYTGTIEEHPVGTTDAERAKNQSEIKKFKIHLEGEEYKLSDEPIVYHVDKFGDDVMRLMRDGHDFVKIKLGGRLLPPEKPHNFFLIPTGGQQGRIVNLDGPFDGKVDSSDFVRIGGTNVPILVESPYGRFVRNTSSSVGITKIENGEHGHSTECPFRNLAIKMSADKLGLIRGEATGLHVQVLGLAEIGQDVPLTLVNQTSDVVLMSEGDFQHMVIKMGDVKPDGIFRIERTLTGIMQGRFSVTATVTWEDQCRRDVEVR